MKPHRTAVITALLVTLGVGGCNHADDTRTTGQNVDVAIAKVDAKAASAKTQLQHDGEQAQQSANHALNSAKEAASDAVVTAGLKTRLATDKELAGADITVETTAGHVILHGTTPDASSRFRATQLAITAKGVLGVDNQLTVVHQN
ncbi:MAG: BON domain-containing protein [Pseudomonadota bacterium]